MNLLALAAILSTAVFTGSLVAYRIRRNQKLAVVERMLVEMGNSLALETDDEDEYDRLRIFEQFVSRLE